MKDIGLTYKGENVFKKLNFYCPGGGRIEHSRKEKWLKIYGRSYGFGLGDHKLALEACKEITDYKEENYETSDSGY